MNKTNRMQHLKKMLLALGFYRGTYLKFGINPKDVHKRQYTKNRMIA